MPFHYLYIARLMQYENVRKKSDEILEYVEPGKCMPSWVKDPIEFWQAADTLNEPMPKSTWSMKLPSQRIHARTA
jgi:hypothetical protein